MRRKWVNETSQYSILEFLSRAYVGFDKSEEKPKKVW